MIDFRKLQAAIWDMDGVLINSEPVHMEAWRMTLEKFKLPLYPDRLKRAFGMTSEMVVQTMLDTPQPEQSVMAIIAEKDRLFQKAIMQNAEMPPGVMSWLVSFKKNGIRQALASSGTPENIQLILKHLEIQSFFEVIVSGEGIPSKPEPFIFIKAANELGVIPPNCLVIEDSIAGIHAAKSAGMRCLAVATTHQPENLDGADIMVENLSQLMVAQIQALFPG